VSHGTLGIEHRSTLRGAQVSEASPRGTYLVISEVLRKKVQGGEFTNALPSEADLMRAHGVSRNTIRRALKALETDGVLESSPGIGWRVAQGGDRRPLVERMTAILVDDALEVGASFPSEAKLCERFAASRTAVRRALALMEGNGLLVTVHGKGRTVRALPSSPGRS
jgi:DNA-binding GntR family transcriptional regulator